jgi:putative ABC transport system permease protein
MIRRTPDLDDLDREIRDHIEAETLDNIGRGMSEADARAAAVRTFGNVTRVKEDVRGVWVPSWLDQVRQDARDAVRSVRRRPTFSLAIVITLALGIGLTTAIYSVVNAVLLRPLDYANPDRVLWLTAKGKDTIDIANSIDFAVWNEQVTSLAHTVAYDYSDSTLVLGGEASRVRIVGASAGFWEVTGARALYGELPVAAAPPSVALVLAHHVFREQFHSDPAIVGKTVTIDGRDATVAAILPEDYRPQLVGRPFDPAFNQVPIGAYRLIPVQPPPQVISAATQVRIYQVIGELKPGVTIEQARAEIEAIHDRWQREHPTPRGASKALAIPLRDKVVGASRQALTLLLSASIVVLLIACANVANLLLARSSERRKEIALRMSVGSGPLRVIRQLLAESLGYAILGGVGGVVFAYWLVNAVIAIMGPAVPRLNETTIDYTVLAVAAATSLVTAVVFGVGPATALVFTNVQEVLKEGGRSVSASRRVLITGRLMAAAQVALTIVLLAGAGLMFKSVWQMTRYPGGFAPHQLLTMRLEFRGPQYREQSARHQLATALLAKARSLPGVRAAEITTGRESTMLVLKENEPIPPPDQRAAREAPVSLISSGFGTMLGMSLARGRWLADVDLPGNDFAVVINEALARRDYSGIDPIGSRIKMPWLGQDRGATIVGVARDLKYADIDRDLAPELFFHYADAPIGSVMLVMRVDNDPLAAAPDIRKALSTIDPSQSFYAIETMEQALAKSIAPRRFNLLLLATFALVALTLAVLGVYGVVAYAVAERTQEIGIRLALGAERARVVRMVMRQGMSGVLAGIVAGLVGAWASTRLMAGLLYGVQPHDAMTFTAATVILAVTAFIACAAPALKAAWVDPVVALRAE